MSLWLATREDGQVLPLVAGVVLLIMALLLLSLGLSSLSVERTSQQAAADNAALAGANVLAKSSQTIRLIDFTIWARNTTVEVLYAAAAAAAVLTLGEATALFSIPMRIQQATSGLVQGLEKTKQVMSELAPVYAIGASMAYIKANGDGRYRGLAVPLPLDLNVAGPGQRERDLRRLVQQYNVRIELGQRRLLDDLVAYRARKAELKGQNLSDAEVERDSKVRELTHRWRQSAGSLGGLTTQRNRRQRELAELLTRGRRRFWYGGAEGIVAVVVSESRPVPFSGWLGTVETGRNVAVASARIQDANPSHVIGAEAVGNLLRGVPVAEAGGEGLVWVLRSVNLVGQRLTGVVSSIGPLGRYLGPAVRLFSFVPPSITEARPVLGATEAVSPVNLRFFLGNFQAIEEHVRDIITDAERRHGRIVGGD